MSKSWLLTGVLLTVFLVDTAAQVERILFPSMESRSQEAGTPTFAFSAAYATSSSPVVISVAGRKLTNADRVHRTNLQKYWLSKHVPAQLVFQSRFLAECELKRPGEYSACDIYSFVDPKTKQQHDYYIYVGIWP